ncbi:hypothetical protein [Paradesulfitobacterium aromaticivorans]
MSPVELIRCDSATFWSWWTGQKYETTTEPEEGQEESEEGKIK